MEPSRTSVADQVPGHLPGLGLSVAVADLQPERRRGRPRSPRGSEARPPRPSGAAPVAGGARRAWRASGTPSAPGRARSRPRARSGRGARPDRSGRRGGGRRRRTATGPRTRCAPTSTSRSPSCTTRALPGALRANARPGSAGRRGIAGRAERRAGSPVVPEVNTISAPSVGVEVGRLEPAAPGGAPRPSPSATSPMVIARHAVGQLVEQFLARRRRAPGWPREPRSSRSWRRSWVLQGSGDRSHPPAGEHGQHPFDPVADQRHHHVPAPHPARRERAREPGAAGDQLTEPPHPALALARRSSPGPGRADGKRSSTSSMKFMGPRFCRSPCSDRVAPPPAPVSAEAATRARTRRVRPRPQAQSTRTQRATGAKPIARPAKPPLEPVRRKGRRPPMTTSSA